MDKSSARDMDNREENETDLQKEDRGVSVIDVAPFCDQLEKFIDYIGNVRDLHFFTYQYPSVLKNRLDTNVQELETILREVKEALINAERIKNQRKSIQREKITVKKILKRMRDDEIKEMECVISLYDKPMYSRWENVKTSQKPEVLEGMLMDIKGKQLALENLTILATRKLGQIRVLEPWNNAGANNEKNLLTIKEKTVIPLPFTAFCSPTIPPPPPLPPAPLSPPISHLPKRSHAQRLSMQRRRRLERNEENLERRCVVSGAPNADQDLPLVPLPRNNPGNLLLANNLLPPEIFSTTSNISREFVSESSRANTASSDRSNNRTLLDTNNNNDNNGASGLGREFQSEMQTVLQALFGELRSAPTILVSDSSSSNTAEIENASSNNGEIELYSLTKNQ